MNKLEQLNYREAITTNGGGLLHMILGAICAVGDYLSDRYTKEVMDTIENGDYTSLVD